jgi:cellulose synthase/poly-beta-1,6-N-acetylglucosamine synthase-like glycosyltransferase
VTLLESGGRTEGPDTVRTLISQRARWQRVITETVWHYRGMLLNPRYGTAGLIGTPYYVLVEVLAGCSSSRRGRDSSM